MKNKLEKTLGAPYPFSYPTDNGFMFSGYEHTTQEAIKVFIERHANRQARHILFNEPKGMSTLEIIETVKRYTSVELAISDIWEADSKALNWYKETYPTL